MALRVTVAVHGISWPLEANAHSRRGRVSPRGERVARVRDGVPHLSMTIAPDLTMIIEEDLAAASLLVLRRYVPSWRREALSRLVS
jgi:hypothetical protein